MADAFTILLPMPQMRLNGSTSEWAFEPGLHVVPMTPAMRSALEDAAKGSPKCSESVLFAIQDADAVVCKQCPWNDHRRVFYPIIFEMIIARFLECFLLSNQYGYSQSPIIAGTSFIVPGLLHALNLNGAIPNDAEWAPEGIKGRFHVRDFRFDASAHLDDLHSRWPNIIRMSGLDSFETCEGILNDQSNLDRFNRAGRESVAHEIETLEAAFAAPASYVPTTEDIQNEGAIRAYRQPFWFGMGYIEPLLEAIDKWKVERRAAASIARLRRAFQVFVDAHGLEQPQRFVNLVMALEALLSTDNSELSFQLATRTAWMLCPSVIPDHMRTKFTGDRCDEFRTSWNAMMQKSRVDTYTEITKMYSLRSKIVHGDKFDFNQLDPCSHELSGTLRMLFRQIIDHQNLFDRFMIAKDEDLKDYLRQLPLQG